MAIFKPGAIVGAISGNVGGACFVNNKGSSVLRQPRSRTGSESPAQLVRQAKLHNDIIRWRDLTSEKKRQWNVAASTITFSNRLGVQRLLSGYQYFLKTSAIFETTNPPQGATTFPDMDVTFASNIGLGIRVIFDNPPSAGIFSGLIQAMPLWRDTPIGFVNFYRNITVIATSLVSIVIITSDFEEIFQLPLLNQYVAFRWITIDKGVLTNQTYTQIIQTGA